MGGLDGNSRATSRAASRATSVAGSTHKLVHAQKIARASIVGTPSSVNSASNQYDPRAPPGSINGDVDSLAQRRVDAVPTLMNNVPNMGKRSPEDSGAVDACNISRSYKAGRKRIAVIKNMDLHLPRGKIYGLLGPSGCGKTTFLKCVTGRLRIHDGSLKVLGKCPNAPGHSVPGKSVGYMPQEEALFSEFTVNETLHFFARLHGMASKIRDRRKKFLYALLEIEDLEDRTISRLSGGQKRRVSFACALLHNPDLLVLDEPTVGVDPLLRAKIWAYLQELTNRPGGPSILITTHYIEEARQSDLVGMMRDGALLAEDTPAALLRQYQCSTLEDVFLLLCRGRGTFNIHGMHQEAVIRYQGPPKHSRAPSGSVTGVASLTGSPDALVETKKENPKSMRRKLLKFYKERNPENAQNVDAILAKYKGREEDLWRTLYRKYPNKLHDVDENELLSEAELAELKRQEAAKAIDEREYKAKWQSSRWKTEVWEEEEDDNQQKFLDEQRQHAHADLLRDELLKLGGTDDGNSDDELLADVAEHGSWVPADDTVNASGNRFVRNTWALTWKNLTKMTRKIGFLCFLFLLPALQVSLFFLAIGSDPKHLGVAVFNEDMAANSTAFDLRQTSLDDGDGAVPSHWSQVYLHGLSNETVTKHYVGSTAAGEAMVRTGKAWGFMHIKRGFGDVWTSLSATNINITALTPELWAGHEIIDFRLDSTQQQIAFVLTMAANDAMKNVVDLALPPNVTSIPGVEHGLVNMGNPIYGDMHPTFTDFMGPGVLVTIGFVQAIGLTAIAFVQDRKEGLLDRCWAAGVRPTEIMLAHLCTQFTVLAVQVALMLLIALVAFSLPMRGELVFVVLLMLLLGLTGMAYGLLISALASTEVDAMHIALGTFFPSMLLSGIIWPLEGMATGLRYVSYVLPTTWAAEAMRSIMLRGWAFDQEPVWAGFAVVFSFIVVLASLSVWQLRSVD
eukprot:m.579068 g.579068  ORF g.579068 m.579068 type:complete len:963 (-) comp22311_c0_seq1:316-3204(-)